MDFFDDLAQKSFAADDFDVTLADDVLTVDLGNKFGTYVINKQTPNRQIWLSSPFSGPKRYDFVAEKNGWFYSREQISLHQRLAGELSECFRRQIDLDHCAYSASR